MTSPLTPEEHAARVRDGLWRSSREAHESLDALLALLADAEQRTQAWIEKEAARQLEVAADYIAQIREEQEYAGVAEERVAELEAALTVYLAWLREHLDALDEEDFDEDTWPVISSMRFILDLDHGGLERDDYAVGDVARYDAIDTLRAAAPAAPQKEQTGVYEPRPGWPS